MTEDDVLGRALVHARSWRAGAPERPVGPRAGVDDLLAVFGGPLPERGVEPVAVIDELARGAEPGLMNIQSGRFFGWVMGGTLTAALAADWLVSAWDQNAGLREAMPAVSVVEEVAGAWVLDLLGLPGGSDVGFGTGATMANFTGLAAARFAMLDRVGWNVHRHGLSGSPRVHVLVGAQRHDTIDLALRYLGLGTPAAVPADAQGRVRLDALAAALDAVPPGDPVIVCLQAGNLHSGAFDPFPKLIALAHERSAWVHVDGAFGLWAAAAPRLSFLTRGVETADSWATDAHKTLNVTYDCGIVVVRDPRASRAAMGLHTSYLREAAGPGNPHEKVPELSRRARGVPVWAALRSLGREGVVDQVERLTVRVRAIADGLADVPGVEVLNDVVYTQVCLDVGTGRAEQVCASLTASGEVWMSPSRWRDRDVIRVSVSNAATTDDDVRRTVEAVRCHAILSTVRAAPPPGDGQELSPPSVPRVSAQEVDQDAGDIGGMGGGDRMATSLHSRPRHQEATGEYGRGRPRSIHRCHCRRRRTPDTGQSRHPRTRRARRAASVRRIRRTWWRRAAWQPLGQVGRVPSHDASQVPRASS